MYFLFKINSSLQSMRKSYGKLYKANEKQIHYLGEKRSAKKLAKPCESWFQVSVVEGRRENYNALV